MRAKDMKSLLSAYKMVGKRATTIRYAFASAEASADEFDLQAIEEALAELCGTKPPEELTCIYCDLPAKTWDHFNRVVKGGKYSGYGHRIRNLVPCCKDCNSAKPEDWESWLRSLRTAFGDNALDIEQRLQRIRAYTEQLQPDSEDDVPSDLRQRYSDLQRRVIDMLGEADAVAMQIREARRSKAATKSISSAPKSITSFRPAEVSPPGQRTKPKGTDVYQRALEAVSVGDGTIGRLSIDLLQQTTRSFDGSSRGHSYGHVLQKLRERFPNNRSTVKTLRWYETKLRKVFGADAVPPRN